LCNKKKRTQKKKGKRGAKKKKKKTFFVTGPPQMALGPKATSKKVKSKKRTHKKGREKLGVTLQNGTKKVNKSRQKKKIQKGKKTKGKEDELASGGGFLFKGERKQGTKKYRGGEKKNARVKQVAMLDKWLMGAVWKRNSAGGTCGRTGVDRRPQTCKKTPN